MKPLNIPFVDLVTLHEQLREELLDVFKSVLQTGMAIGGPMVEEFEKDFAAFCGVKYCIGVSSGTDALRFALMAAGVSAGDGVITVAHTFIATAEAIVQSGATPHFVDIDPKTYNIGIAALQEYLTLHCDRCEKTGVPIHRASRRRITAIVPVHLYGQVADMDSIAAIAKDWNLMVIEDACQAHGAGYFSKTAGTWKKAGSMGRAAAFSFYPAKNLGACGEGGAVTTDDEILAQKIRMLRDHGQQRKYYHLLEGYNGRLDAVQAGILRIKLRHLDEGNRHRREAADIYHGLLQSVDGIVTPLEPAGSRAVYHLYVIRSRQRDALQLRLTEANIGTGLHYPVPLHLQPAYARFDHHPGDLPESEAAAREVLSLPLHPHIERPQQEIVALAVSDFYSAHHEMTLGTTAS